MSCKCMLHFGFSQVLQDVNSHTHSSSLNPTSVSPPNHHTASLQTLTSGYDENGDPAEEMPLLEMDKIQLFQVREDKGDNEEGMEDFPLHTSTKTREYTNTHAQNVGGKSSRAVPQRSWYPEPQGGRGSAPHVGAEICNDKTLRFHGLSGQRGHARAVALYTRST